MNTVRIGVTGMSRAGKTVFLTSLIHHLMEGTAASLPELAKRGIEYAGKPEPLAMKSQLADESKSIGATLRSVRDSCFGKKQPLCHDRRLKQLPYEDNMVSFRRNPPGWPPSTIEAYTYRLRLDFRNLGGKKKSRKKTVVVELFDYPGESLVDVPLSYKHWDTWSRDTIRRIEGADLCSTAMDYKEKWERTLQGIVEEPDGSIARQQADQSALAYRAICRAAKKAGAVFSPVSPLLMPDDPELPPWLFCPMPEEVAERCPSVVNVMRERYEEYVQQEVTPFVLRLSRCTHQFVLIDLLDVLRKKAKRFNQVRQELQDVLECFDYLDDKAPWLRAADRIASWFGLPGRIRKVTFCATKADQVQKDCRGNLPKLLRDLFQKAAARMKVCSVTPSYEYCASIRAAEDCVICKDGKEVPALKGAWKEGSEWENKRFRTLEIPIAWPHSASAWPEFDFVEFAPPQFPEINGVLPSLRMDNVLYQMLEDYL